MTDGEMYNCLAIETTMRDVGNTRFDVDNVVVTDRVNKYSSWSWWNEIVGHQ